MSYPSTINGLPSQPGLPGVPNTINGLPAQPGLPYPSVERGVNHVPGVLGGAASGATVGTMIAPGVGTVIGAGIGLVASLFGAKKSSNAARDSAKIQTDFSQKALDEQKRVYDIEKADEARQRAARAALTERYTNNTQRLGSLPNSFGMSDEQMARARQGAGPSQGSQGMRKPLPPSQPQPGERTMPTGPRGGGRPMVTLQAPTGEVMDVDLDQAPELIKRGAIMVGQTGVAPTNAFGRGY